MKDDCKDRDKKNRQTLIRLVSVVAGMFAFAILVLPPLYDLICDITGLNGKTGRAIEEEIQASMAVDTERLITVEFVTNVNNELPWQFKAETRTVKVHPGEIKQVSFYARNVSDEPIRGRAIPSVVPGVASKYFQKTECFCFSQQTLDAGEEKEMPVRFVIDPELPKHYQRVTLSYTFFRNENTQGQEQKEFETLSSAEKWVEVTN